MKGELTADIVYSGEREEVYIRKYEGSIEYEETSVNSIWEIEIG